MKNWRIYVVLAGALLKGYAIWLVGSVAVWAIVALLMFATGTDLPVMVLVLTAGVAVILFLAVALNVLKKKL